MTELTKPFMEGFRDSFRLLAELATIFATAISAFVNHKSVELIQVDDHGIK